MKKKVQPKSRLESSRSMRIAGRTYCEIAGKLRISEAEARELVNSSLKEGYSSRDEYQALSLARLEFLQRFWMANLASSVSIWQKEEATKVLLGIHDRIADLLGLKIPPSPVLLEDPPPTVIQANYILVTKPGVETINPETVEMLKTIGLPGTKYGPKLEEGTQKEAGFPVTE